MSDVPKPLDLESIEAARADYTKPGQAPEEQAHRAHGLAIYSVPALVAEVKRLREARVKDRERAACIAENEDSGADAAEHIREMDLP